MGDAWHQPIEQTISSCGKFAAPPDDVWIGQHAGGFKKMGEYKKSGCPFNVDEGQMRMFCNNPNDSNICIKDNTGGKFIRLGEDSNVYRYKKGPSSLVLIKGNKCVVSVMSTSETPNRCQQMGEVVQNWLKTSGMEN